MLCVVLRALINSLRFLIQGNNFKLTQTQTFQSFFPSALERFGPLKPSADSKTVHKEILMVDVLTDFRYSLHHTSAVSCETRVWQLHHLVGRSVSETVSLCGCLFVCLSVLCFPPLPPVCLRVCLSASFFQSDVYLPCIPARLSTCLPACLCVWV